MNDIFYVQVKDKETGAEYPVPLERYHNAPDLFERLDEPPVDPQSGLELPYKPKTSAAKKATPKSGQKADPDKETS